MPLALVAVTCAEMWPFLYKFPFIRPPLRGSVGVGLDPRHLSSGRACQHRPRALIRLQEASGQARPEGCEARSQA